MDNRKLQALVDTLRHRTPVQVDEALCRLRLDVIDRVAVKHALGATAGRTVTAAGPSQAHPTPELARVLRRLGLVAGEPVTVPELEARMAAAGLDDVATRIGVKIAAEQAGLLATRQRYANEAERLLEHLGITGPVSLETIEREMDVQGWGVTAKNVVKSELASRGWLRVDPRTMRASADVAPVKRGLTLRSRPW